MEILDKKYTYTQLIKTVYPKEVIAQQKLSYSGPKPAVKDLKAIKDSLSVVVDNDPLINYYFCPECTPKVDQKIIAKTGRDGIIIHTIHCVSMKTISFDKLLEAHRYGSSENTYLIKVEIKLSKKS